MKDTTKDSQGGSMIKFREEDLQKLKEEDEALYNSIMELREWQKQKELKERMLADKFWSMVDASENKDKRQ